MFGIRCIQVWLLMQASNALHVSDVEIVYPKRHHKDRQLHDLGTLNQNGNHEEYVTYEIKAKNDHHFLDLKKIEPSHQKFIWLRSFKNGKEVAVKHFPENCYYEGKIQGIEDSYAYISTCSGGLTGTIDNGKIRYDITPQDDGIGHNFRNVENLMKKKYKDSYGNIENLMKKKYKDTYDNVENLMKKKYKDYENHKVNQEKRNMKTRRTVSLSDDPLLIDVEPQYVEYTRKETLYAKILVSCDHRMLPKYKNNRQKLIERVLNAYGQVDRAYQAINVRIVVVAIDIQEKAPAFERFKESDDDLWSFGIYIKDVIKKTSSFKNVDFDNAMLLSHNKWPHALGLAELGAICLQYDSRSINYWEYDDISSTVHSLGHEFGHNMGFKHDEGEAFKCDAPSICLTTRGCFMMDQNKEGETRPGFSNCSMAVFEESEYPCLLDGPTNIISNKFIQSFTKVCGNGIPEGDEQCDCGTLEMCKANGDNCCEPNNCVLKVNAQCSPLKNPECCQPSCLYKRQGTLCRKAAGECDLPEYCQGDKPTCPDDKNSSNGVSCGSSVKFFRGPSADSPSSISRLSPPIISQYLKVLPKQWNGSYPCLNLDILGCPAVQDCDVSLLKTLPVSAYTASSKLKEKYNPSNVVKTNGWCPRFQTDNWFEINFGKRVKITTLKMNKPYWYTTWFTLQYSDDGDSWTDYLESDPDELKKLKSVCFSGSCQLTLTEQCRTLSESDALIGPCWNILNQKNSNKNGIAACESNHSNKGLDLDGTICAENKFCFNKRCKSAEEHGFKCPIRAGKECSGNGACSLDGTCVCNNGYNQMDDCLTKLKPIDGKWGKWSDYTKCSSNCNGIKKRYRFCSHPAPRYGGKECDGESSMEQTCSNPCPTTRIKTPGDKFCIEPETGICSVADNTALVFRSTSSYCKSDASMFVFNPKTGSLLHKCSNKFVCPKYGITSDSPMVVSSTCIDSSISSQIQQTIWKTLQIDTFCLTPPKGNLINDVKVQLSRCYKYEQKLLMSDLGKGNVFVSYFEDVANMEALKENLNNPKTEGFVDNLDFPSYYIDEAGIRMQVYFRAPESGDYFFNISCSDTCELLFTKDVSDISSAEKIASCPSWTDRYKWSEYEEQMSSAITLKADELYYLEMILFNKRDLTSGAAAVLLPSGTFVAPISYEYLEKY